jgi:tetratricopeptide (TPR) repeat protein
MSGQIFISYRREESRWSARSLNDRLSTIFGPQQIFMDIDAIALGEDFVEAIETTVARCDVLIAVIGANWLTSKDDHGNRRLDNPEDFVRMEIATALKRKIRVIPILFDGVLVPGAPELPDDLKPLVRRHALRISDTSFDGDCQRLVAAIKLVLDKAAAEKQRQEAERLEAQLLEKERLLDEGREKVAAVEHAREKIRLEEERRKREEKQRKELENSEAQRLENERLVNERREKDRLEVEQRQRESTSIPPSPPHSQDFKPVQAETSPIVESKPSTKQKPSAYVPLAGVILILIVAVIWVGGHSGRKVAPVTQTPESTLSPTTKALVKGYETTGYWAYFRKLYDEAIRDYTQAITADPYDGAAYQGRGLAYQKQGNKDKAEADFAKAKELGYTGSQ